MKGRISGKIVEINVESGCGLIIDENNQDISFEFEQIPIGIKKDSKVAFSIIISNDGLTAVNINAL